jgi:hypothetical protein
MIFEMFGQSSETLRGTGPEDFRRASLLVYSLFSILFNLSCFLVTVLILRHWFKLKLWTNALLILSFTGFYYLPRLYHAFTMSRSPFEIVFTGMVMLSLILKLIALLSRSRA